MESNVALVAVAAFAFLSAWATYRALRTINTLDKYETENRTDGGAVNFASNKDAVAHRNKRMGADSLMKMGCLFTALSFGAFLILFFFVQ